MAIGEQIVGGAQFAGGVTLEGEQRVVVGHAVAVVDDADHALAAGFDFDANAVGAGVERVFEQLLDDGGGALDDFAGGDAVGDSFREYADAAHAVRSFRCRSFESDIANSVRIMPSTQRTCPLRG